MYDPKQYWEGRGKDYRASNPTWEEESKTLWEHLVDNNLLKQAKPMLEVGSGEGRIYNFLGIGNLYMCDIVDSLRHKCCMKTGVMPDRWDGVTLPYEDGEFSLVISYSVLLHVPPNSIMNHISELLRVGKEVYIATYSGLQNGKHYFAHDYLELFKELEAELVSCKTFCGNRVHYVVRK